MRDQRTGKTFTAQQIMVEHRVCYPWTAERSVQADQFLMDLIAVYEKHGMALGHQDSQGGFIVEALTEHHVSWLFQASEDQT